VDLRAEGGTDPQFFSALSANPSRTLRSKAFTAALAEKCCWERRGILMISSAAYSGERTDMRRTLVSLAILMLSFATPATAQERQVAKAGVPQLETQVRKLWEAFKNKDKATLSSLIDDQFRMFEEGLATFADKKAEVNAPDEYELLNYTLNDFTVRPLGPSTALVTYRAQYEGKAGGEIAKGNSIFGEVWTGSGKGWKVLYLQETYIK